MDWGNTKNVVYDLFGPAKFGNYLLGCLGGERSMAPGMNTNLMTGDIFSLQDRGLGNSSRTYDEHSRAEVDLV